MKIAIYGYGNLGKQVELAVKNFPDVEIFGIFTDRNVLDVKQQTTTNVYSAKDIFDYEKEIDVLLICKGSAVDVPLVAPKLCSHFNTVDSFDTHAKIENYYGSLEEISTSSNHVNLISCGWDPGLFSLFRTLFSSVLQGCNVTTTWGKGISQGHGDAVRKVKNVVDALSFTVPIPRNVKMRRRSSRDEKPDTKRLHKRVVYVVKSETASKAEIRNSIKNIPNYFKNQPTYVRFISRSALNKMKNLSHKGSVFIDKAEPYGVMNEISPNYNFTENGKRRPQILSLKTKSRKITATLSLDLFSNPYFTANVMLAYSRAVFRFAQSGRWGVKTVLDVPASMLLQNNSDYFDFI